MIDIECQKMSRGNNKKRTFEELSKTMASSACLHAQPKSFSASFNGLTRTETDIFSSLVKVLPPPPVPMTRVCVCVYIERVKNSLCC